MAMTSDKRPVRVIPWEVPDGWGLAASRSWFISALISPRSSVSKF